MYINKYTHEVVKDCDLTLEHGYDEKYIFVPKGATFAIGTSFDGDFCWRKDRYYLNTNHIMSGCLKSTNVDVKTHKDTYELNTLWIHPDVKQKMLQGEIPNQITEKEWMPGSRIRERHAIFFGGRERHGMRLCADGE